MKLDPKTVLVTASLLLGLSFAMPQEGRPPGEIPLPGHERKPVPQPTPTVDPAKSSQPVAATGSQNTALAAEIKELRAEQEALRATLKGVVDYLDQRALAVQDLERSLALVESSGFTAGINGRSREVLLSSWRGFLAKEKVALPAMAPLAKTNGKAPASTPRSDKTSAGARWR